MADIEDTFAEAFTSYYSRFLITAVNEKLAKVAAQAATGYGTSMIGCSAEAGIEKYLQPVETPDNRPGCVVQIWTAKKKIKDELLGRIGQCVLTAPTAAVWNFCKSEEKLSIGHMMRFFGDGYEEEKVLYGRQVCVIPTMTGEFIIERELGIAKGVAGGNFLILAESVEAALAAGEKAVEAISKVEGVITPFPGGVCASGSKIGSKKYKFMHATTNERYCPTICSRVKETAVKGIGSVLEIVINGISEARVKDAMYAGVLAAAEVKGVEKISAGNYGGALGSLRIPLRGPLSKKI